MKKTFAAAFLALMLCVLAGCRQYPPLDTASLSDELAECYADGEFFLDRDTAPIIIDLSIVPNDPFAFIECRARAISADGTYARVDRWLMSYSYDKAAGDWRLSGTNLRETDWQLLSDLSEEACLAMIGEHETEIFTLESVATDRSARTASAVYSYRKTTATLGTLGSITLHASVDASFIWDPENGWTFAGSAFGQNTAYLCDLDCHIDYDGGGMLNADRFSMAFDLVVIQNLVAVENFSYQGGVCSLGRLHVGNARFSAADEGRAALITFDYVRDIRNIQSDPNYLDADEYREFYRTAAGTGTIRIAADETGEYFAELSLPGFLAGRGGAWIDFLTSDVRPEPIDLPKPAPEPEIAPEPEPEPEEVLSCAGEWIAILPESSGLSGEVRARLSEDGTCSVVCDFGMGTIRKNGNYRLLDDPALLPADLLGTLIAGNTPTVCAVYDPAEDRLIVCLEEGVYLYFSRVEA